jgi:acyl-CoA thioesterase
LDDLSGFVERDGFARHVGVQVLDYGEGHARARLDVAAHHLNSLGTLHGGAIFSLADAAFAVAANSRGLALATNVDVAFFKMVRAGALVAEAHEVARNARMATYLVEVRDDGGALVAQMQGTVYRKRGGRGVGSSEPSIPKT